MKEDDQRRGPDHRPEPELSTGRARFARTARSEGRPRRAGAGPSPGACNLGGTRSIEQAESEHAHNVRRCDLGRQLMEVPQGEIRRRLGTKASHPNFAILAIRSIRSESARGP